MLVLRHLQRLRELCLRVPSEQSRLARYVPTQGPLLERSGGVRPLGHFTHHPILAVLTRTFA
jgi:hypothetical protein